MKWGQWECPEACVDEQNKGRAVCFWLFQMHMEAGKQHKSLCCSVKIGKMISFMALHSKILVLSLNTIVVQVAGKGEVKSSWCLLYRTCNRFVKQYIYLRKMSIISNSYGFRCVRKMIWYLYRIHIRKEMFSCLYVLMCGPTLFDPFASL